jgi:tetratricopeptide (TPR) repeat protein
MIQANISNETAGAAIIFRSLALFAILYQFRLIAADMADTPVFTSALFAAFATAAILGSLHAGGKKLSPLAVLVAIGLIPWLARALIALPRLFIPHSAGRTAIAFDSLLLNLDRNNFVSLLPFYWAAVTTLFSLHSRRFMRAAIIADTSLLLVLYSIVRTMDINLYRWPVVMISLFAVVIFFQALALVFSLPPEFRLRTAEKISAILALFVLIFIGGLLFLGPSQKRALEKGGGLLEPKLFSFDFSQFLRLDSEISTNDDLVLIVKKEGDDYDEHILLRRSVLSGYSRKQGFFRVEELDERTHPQRLPGRAMEIISHNVILKAAKPIRQEYFLVNFDAAAFIGMNQPEFVTPYENWDASSFRSAYMVDSMVCDATIWELLRASSGLPNTAEAGLSATALGLSEAEYKTYTEYGGDERILTYAEGLSNGFARYGDKVMVIYESLKYGEYRYSLKPGIAPDGDQLAFFLFQTKKGYCSYYAFAMTLLLRSLGIPARLAAGFFIDPSTNTFDYYPVRSGMAHAWVEVFFPGYGWIEFDPTTENLAEGEEFRFSSGVDPKLFERLMREILENRQFLRIREGRNAATSPASAFAQSAAALLKKYWWPPFLLILVLIFVYIRCGALLASRLYRDKRKKALRLWKHCRWRLRLAGLGFQAVLHESEWAQTADAQVQGTYAMYQGVSSARYAPDYSIDDFSLLQENYRAFSAAYQKSVSAGRRLLAWVFPPLALILGAGKSAKTPKVKRKNPSTLPLLLLAAFLAGSGVGLKDVYAQDAETDVNADVFYNNARNAEYAENWEQAIELYKGGGKLFPDDPRFPWSLGSLYYSRSLYRLAWDEYRKAEAIDPFDLTLILKLAHTAGYLNRSAASVHYFERALMLDPDNLDAISSLGWMYFKVHRLDDGERLLNAALERFGDEADLSMTLGTIYSEMYRYDESKYWYQKAIRLGEELRDRSFTAVAHYNLSILEAKFYYYNLAMDATNASLSSQNRASGLLARGELNLCLMELKQAQLDYQAAYEIDSTPLAKINLAQAYMISGRLEEARRYAEDCLKSDDLSWMLNFGIDPDRFKRDIHEILYKTYKGLAQTERFLPWGRADEKISSLLRLVSYNFKSAVHRKLFQKYSLAAADAYSVEYFGDSPHLDSYIQYYNSFETYPRRAINYLSRARDFETAIIPASMPSYDLEEGVLFKNIRKVERALAGFEPRWERQSIASCYSELATRGTKGIASKAERNAIKQAAAEELFALNCGGLKQAGIRMPVEIHLAHNAESLPGFYRGEKVLLKTLKKAGFAPVKNGASARFKLNMNITGSSAQGYAVDCRITDTAGSEIFHRSLPLRSFSRVETCDFARNLSGCVFKVE